MRFSSVGIEVSADGGVVAHGELSIKGRTQPLRATGSITPALEDPFGGVRRGLELEAIIDRRVYGLEWTSRSPRAASRWTTRSS